MDPLTHAASGAIAWLCLPARPQAVAGLALAAAACASPDLDLLFIHTPLEFLQIHRGISHSFAGMPVFGFLLALLSWPLWRRSTPARWSFLTVWLFCMGMILLHIWLDVVTTYGTMVFLPFSHYRVRLNSIYMIDFAVMAPLFLGLLFFRRKRWICIGVLIWTFLFPASGIAINYWHTEQARQRFVSEQRQVQKLHILPDVFAPIFWRLIYEEDGHVKEQSLDWRGEPRSAPEAHPAAPAALVEHFKAQSAECFDFFNFAMLPVMDDLRDEDKPDSLPLGPDTPLYLFYDLRFGSGLEFVRKLIALRPNADLPFQLMVETAPDFEDTEKYLISRVRLRFSDSGRDSHWRSPRPPQQPTWLQWLVGLR